MEDNIAFKIFFFLFSGFLKFLSLIYSINEIDQLDWNKPTDEQLVQNKNKLSTVNS